MEHTDIVKDYRTVMAIAVLTGDTPALVHWIASHTQEQITELIDRLEEERDECKKRMDALG